MSDNIDDQDMSFAEGGEAEAAPAKAKGAGPGILRILMIVGIALGAVILIVTVVVVTVNIMNAGGKTMQNRRKRPGLPSPPRQSRRRGRNRACPTTSMTRT